MFLVFIFVVVVEEREVTIIILSVLFILRSEQDMHGKEDISRVIFKSTPYSLQKTVDENWLSR